MQSAVDLSPVTEAAITLEAGSHINKIATYLASTEKAAVLNAIDRRHLADELELKFFGALSSEWINGIAKYSIAYCRKK